MEGKYNKELGIASIEADGIKVLNLVQNPQKKQPLISAYLGARYSRSNLGVEEIAKEVLKKDIDAAKRLENIFEGYGHRSVGQMALSSIFLENIPMITATRIFNIVPDHAGQERSTRYQDYSEPNFIIPEFKDNQNKSKELYLKIMYNAFRKYEELYNKTYKEFEKYFRIDKNNKEEVSALKARVLDTVRYILPLGTNTSINLVTNATNLSELISKFKSSTQKVENDLGEVLFKLLTKDVEIFQGETEYIAELDNLIRHADINLNIPNTIYFSLLTLIKYIENNERRSKEIKRQIEEIKTKSNRDKDNNLNSYEGFEILVPGNNLSLHLIENLFLLINPHINFSELEIEEYLYKELKSILSKSLTHRDTLGNIAQSGSVVFDGYIDVGMLRDLNRHRSLERYIPILENRFNLENELEISNYNICPYLEIEDNQIKELKKEYIKYFEELYKEIRKWLEINKEEGLYVEEILEYGRYLLPMAHNTRCRIGGSFNDIQYVCSLRTRPGGHIGYRILTYNWLNKLVESEPLLEEVLEKIPNPKYNDRKEFLDRT